jgi:uncharacterized membrane protein (GlpM family)
MKLLVKALIGAVVVVIIQLLAQTRNYYIAGLVPLFPTFTLISHYVVGTQRTSGEMRSTIRFGMAAILPYMAYMVALYVLVERWRLIPSLIAASLCWLIAAVLLIVVWNRWVA